MHFLSFFLLYLSLHNCISFAKYQNESATGKNFKERGFPEGTVVKNPPANTRDAGDQDLIPGSGRSTGGVNGNPL